MESWSQLRRLFPGSFRLTDDELKDLWSSAAFVLDANVVLNLYRYSPSAKIALQAIFQAAKDRIWIPFQVALELQRNRLTVIAEQIGTYHATNEEASKLLRSIEDERSHPFVSEPLLNQLKLVLSNLRDELDAKLRENEQLLQIDTEFLHLSELLDKKIGDEPSDDELSKQLELAKRRFEKKIPPGFKDKKQDGLEYGDCLVWLQTLDYARASKKPVIFVTDDGKEDWWEKVRGRTIGPRPELVREFHKAVGLPFHMYQPSQFVKFASEHFKIEIPTSVISEVRAVTQERMKSVQEASAEHQDLHLNKELSAKSLRAYMRSKFPKRGLSSLLEIERLVGELLDVGITSIREVDDMVTEKWEEFSEYESNRIRSGRGRFRGVGVVRVMKDDFQ